MATRPKSNFAVTRQGRKTRVSDFMRERIETATLVKQLTKHALTIEEVEVTKLDVAGTAVTQVERREWMTPSQVTAALGLLKKSLPDLAAQQIQVNANQTLLDVLAGFSPSAKDDGAMAPESESVRPGSAGRFDA